MPPRAALMLAAALAAAEPLQGQETPPLLGREIELADFGVTAGSGTIARGRVSVVLAPDGPRLDVNYLATSPPPSSPPPSPGDAGAGPPVPERAAEPPPGGAPSGAREPLSALWVWSTEELLADASARATFLEFVRQRRIDRVFLQLVPGPGLASSAGFVPFDGALLGPLVAELRARGALTYALDGDPRYVRPENHAGVLRTVARVADHNRRVPPEQRFYGVRYDVEPYILPGFQGPRRAAILADYVRLVEAVSGAARAAELAVGLDIPFWLDGRDEVTGARFEALLDGRPTPVLARLLELADDMAVMAYRTFADGPDGVLAHTHEELARAAGQDVEVFVGIETTPLADERRYTFRGRGRSGLPTVAEAPWIVLEEREDEPARVWLVQGAEALGALAEATSGSASLRHWFAGTPVPLPGSALSFHSLGAEAMVRTAEEVLARLGGSAAFRGIAYHDYSGLRALLEGR